MIEKIISGGQTGIDQMALEIAFGYGIPTGGTAHKGFKTEAGINLELRDKYGLVECDQWGYPPRTRKNIEDSDATVIYTDFTYSETSPGTKLTKELCVELGKPYIEDPGWERFARFVEEHNVKILNVAGPRASNISNYAYYTNQNLFYRGLLLTNPK